MAKTWQVADQQTIKNLEDLESLLGRQRGLTDKNKGGFFAPVYEKNIHNPQLLWSMQTAIDAIYAVAASGKRILVWGDYDVDGVTATAIMVITLQNLGVSVIPYLPHREEDGYGLNKAVLEDMLDQFDLLITVDCGVSNLEEIAWLKQLGKAVIVVDHHELPALLPLADAIIHPRHPQGEYPWGQLCGAATAWKLAQGLMRDERNPHSGDPDREKWLLDLALLGTIGDIMPLLDENRAIVKFGLAILQLAKRPGIRALLEAARLPANSLTVEEIAFRVVPLLNAAGRMDHPQTALNVLLAANQRQAQQYVAQLQTYNQQRQVLTRSIVESAEESVDEAAAIIFASNMAWPAGVVGLVAGRLAAKFSRPAVVIGSNGRHAVGSARTANGINILEGLRVGVEHTIRLGGHAQAAGFSVHENKIESFRLTVEEYFRSQPQVDYQEHDYSAEAIVSCAILDWDLTELLQKFEPFGPGNTRPNFIIRDLVVIDKFPVGKKQQHTRVALAANNKEIEGIAFGLESDQVPDGKVDVLGQLEINNFGGRPRLQFKIEDIITAGEVVISSSQK